MRPVPLDRICAATAALSLSRYPSRRFLRVVDVHAAPLRGGWTSRAFHILVQTVARRSQCRQLRHQTTSSRYRTTRPSRSWSAHRAEHQVTFSSTPISKMILNPVPDFEEPAPTNREMLAELLQR